MIQSNQLKMLVLVAGMILSGSLCAAAKLEFSLTDAWGRQVTSQDYSGVPLFLEFGACW